MFQIINLGPSMFRMKLVEAIDLCAVLVTNADCFV